MLDFAELVVLNKFDKRGAEDALRDVRKQWRRNRVAFKTADEDVPVFPTIASQFNDPGVTWMFANLCRAARREKRRRCRPSSGRPSSTPTLQRAAARTALIPGARVRYLAEIAEQGRGSTRAIERAGRGRRRARSRPATSALQGAAATPRCRSALDRLRREPTLEPTATRGMRPRCSRCASATTTRSKALGAEALELLRGWPARLEVDHRRGHRVHGPRPGDHGRELPRVAEPPEDPEDRARRSYKGWGDLLRFLLKENLPGAYPYTGGVYPVPPRGRGPDAHVRGRGHARAHQPPLPLPAASASQPRACPPRSTRVTLYGEDPAPRPDIYGKIGNSGVSIATLDDMKKLYSGFDLCAPTTSVSMTINGPAPMILAMFMNAAIDQQVEKYLREDDGALGRDAQRRSTRCSKAAPRPQYDGELPDGQRRPRPRPARRHRRRARRRRDLRAHQGGDAADRARHRAGRHPQGRPGAEHLHLLAPSSRCA